MNFKAVFCRGSKWQRERALIIHGLLLPTLVKVTVLKAAGLEEGGKGGVVWPNGLVGLLSLFFDSGTYKEI